LKAVSKEMQLDCIGTGSDLRLFDRGGIAVKKEKKKEKNHFTGENRTKKRFN
jgi:hypothetical protein